jgi:hypothetical protein
MTGRRPWPHVYGTLIWLKRPLYWLGLRPKAGSILHSPSLALVFGWYDAERADEISAPYQSVTIDVGPTMD